MRLNQDLLVFVEGVAKLFPRGTSVVLEADLQTDVKPEMQEEVPDIFSLDEPSIEKPGKVAKEQAAKAMSDLKRVAHKVNNLQDEEVKTSANTIVNAFARVLQGGDLMKLKEFVKQVADRIKSFGGDKNHPGYLGIKLVWPALAEIVQGFAGALRECKEFLDMLSEAKMILAEAKIDWNTGLIID